MGTKIDSTTGVTITTPPSASAKAGGTRAGGPSAVASTSAGGDTVHLTGDAMQFKDLSQTLSRSPAVDVKRVAEMRSSIASGQYTINDKAVAAKLLMFDRKLGN
jgi:flagellar biosynthesis anti-sigma factor FlgM